MQLLIHFHNILKNKKSNIQMYDYLDILPLKRVKFEFLTGYRLNPRKSVIVISFWWFSMKNFARVMDLLFASPMQIPT